MNPRKLTVLFDDSCGVCTLLRSWLSREPAYVEVELLPMNAEKTRARFPGLIRRIDAGEFLVVDEQGNYYAGASAKIMCLWAMRRYRPLALRLATPMWQPMTERAFDYVAANRHHASNWLMRVSPEVASRTLKARSSTDELRTFVEKGRK